MDKTDIDYFLLTSSTGSLKISADDEVARKLAMLFEGKCTDLGPSKAAEKYGYTKQRFFQLFDAFQEEGSGALISKKKGPQKNYVRTDNVVSQVIRHRFLDPDANAAVIAQKMKQTGIKISQRSVERIIAENGLQKKTLQVSSQRRSTRD